MIDETLYKQALGLFPSGVTVVTAYDQQGQVVGLTASAFTALSISPPLILVCPNYESDSYPVLSEQKKFAINILSSTQTQEAYAFAKKGEAKTEAIKEIPMIAGEFQTPLMEGAVASFECSLWREYEGGDHAILVGEIQRVTINESASPMVYSQGKMCELS